MNKFKFNIGDQLVMNKFKFNIGDQVRCIDAGTYLSLTQDKTYYIIDINQGTLTLEGLEDVSFFVCRFELYKAKQDNANKFKKGDRIKCIEGSKVLKLIEDSVYIFDRYDFQEEDRLYIEGNSSRILSRRFELYLSADVVEEPLPKDIEIKIKMPRLDTSSYQGKQFK